MRCAEGVEQRSPLDREARLRLLYQRQFSAQAIDVLDDVIGPTLARDLAGSVAWLKIGLEAFAAHGPSLVEDIRALGPRVFLDLKLHDIPNTVSAASRNCALAGASLITVHASGGRAMLEAALEGVSGFKMGPLIVAVTILTSLDEAALAEVGFAGTPKERVLRGAQLALSSGLDGVVSSAKEANSIREVCGADFFIVTPGIRPDGAASDDQRRVVSPSEAIALGSDLLVVGRPVTQSSKPLEVVENLLAEIKKGGREALQ